MLHAYLPGLTFFLQNHLLRGRVDILLRAFLIRALEVGLEGILFVCSLVQMQEAMKRKDQAYQFLR